MTAREHAASMIADIRLLAGDKWLSDEPIVNRIMMVVDAAVKEEREACAKIAETPKVIGLPGYEGPPSAEGLLRWEISTAIRKRDQS